MDQKPFADWGVRNGATNRSLKGEKDRRIAAGNMEKGRRGGVGG